MNITTHSYATSYYSDDTTLLLVRYYFTTISLLLRRYFVTTRNFLLYYTDVTTLLLRPEYFTTQTLLLYYSYTAPQIDSEDTCCKVAILGCGCVVAHVLPCSRSIVVLQYSSSIHTCGSSIVVQYKQLLEGQPL